MLEQLENRLAPASGGSIISPISATIEAGGPGFGSINETLNQSGLTSGFTSGVTDFDTYLATNPRHTMTFPGFEWFSNSGTTGATVTYDLGAVLTIDQLALWNEESSGIGTLDLLSSTDGVTFTPLASGLHPTDNPVTNPIDSPPYLADVFTFAPTQARYVRFVASDSPQPDPGSFPSAAIGEVAFRAAGRTFVFFFAGLSTSSGTDNGMQKLSNFIGNSSLADEINNETVLLAPVLGWAKPSPRDPLKIQEQLNRARDSMNTFLTDHQYNPESDMVVLIGHSFGAHLATILATDVQSSVTGNDPAEGLITLDPINWDALGFPGLNQSSLVVAAPEGVPLDAILNFVQRNPNESLQGYTIAGTVYDDFLGRGPDGLWGTRDDTTHKLIDDDLGKRHDVLGIYDAITGFISSLIGSA